jgi:hypothetical protein
MPQQLPSSTGAIGKRRFFHDVRKPLQNTGVEPEQFLWKGHPMNIPVEISFGGVYLPPLFIAGILGTLVAVVTARILNRYRLSRFFFYPPLVFVALTIIYTVFIGTVFIPS